MSDKYTFVTTPDKMPSEPHWAIISYESRYIEGDQRSRDHPGHGYPATTLHHVNYLAFTNEEEWKAEVVRRATPSFGSPKPFTAIYVVPATVTTSTNVNVKIA